MSSELDFRLSATISLCGIYMLTVQNGRRLVNMKFMGTPFVSLIVNCLSN